MGTPLHTLYHVATLEKYISFQRKEPFLVEFTGHPPCLTGHPPYLTGHLSPISRSYTFFFRLFFTGALKWFHLGHLPLCIPALAFTANPGFFGVGWDDHCKKGGMQ